MEKTGGKNQKCEGSQCGTRYSNSNATALAIIRQQSLRLLDIMIIKARDLASRHDRKSPSHIFATTYG